MRKYSLRAYAHAVDRRRRLQGASSQVNLDNVAAAISVSERDLTGVVVDIGEGATHCVPIISGYVVSTAIRSALLAGSDITAYIQSSLRERGQPLPAEGSWDLCRCVVCLLATPDAEAVPPFGVTEPAVRLCRAGRDYQMSLRPSSSTVA